MKTYEEIAAEIRNRINIGFDYADGKDKTALVFYDSDAEIILQALEKQVAKPIEYAGRCLTCDEIWYGYDDGYCTNCGQKLEDVNCRKEVQP